MTHTGDSTLKLVVSKRETESERLFRLLALLRSGDVDMIQIRTPKKEGEDLYIKAYKTAA